MLNGIKVMYRNGRTVDTNHFEVVFVDEGMKSHIIVSEDGEDILDMYGAPIGDTDVMKERAKAMVLQYKSASCFTDLDSQEVWCEDGYGSEADEY